MKIAFDFHGVIEARPDIFHPLMAALVHMGNEVYILTGPTEDEARVAIKRAGYIEGVHFLNVLSIVDHLKAGGVKVWRNKDGTAQADYKDWWSSKSIICKELEIDMLFDDSEQYCAFIEKGDKPLFFHVREGR